MDKRFCILLADDRADDRALMEVVLRDGVPAARVLVATDAVELGQLLEREAFDAALIEGELGWSDPSRLVAQLRGKNAGTAVIFYSQPGLRVLTPELADLHLSAYYSKSPADLLRIPRVLATRLTAPDAATGEASGAMSGLVAQPAAAAESASTALFQVEMLQAISHDLRQPLQIFTRQIKLLDRNYKSGLDAAGKGLVENMGQVADHMDLLLDSILSYYQLNQESDEIHQAASLAEVIDAVLAALGSSLEEVGGRVEPGAMPELTVDRGRMSRLFQNLIDNAIKFRGSAPLVIGIDALDVNDYWLFTVRDNGVGMDGDKAEQAFALFRRLHSQDRYPGSGVGLALCRRIIEQQGGKIWADSTPGVGTAIHFTLPKQGNTNNSNRAQVRQSGHDITHHKGSPDRG